MNTMSEPRSIDLIRSYSSRAAWRPSSGSEPDPSPRVIDSPMCSVSCAADCCSDCRSVLIAEELDALDLRLDHPVDRVDPGPADADDAQHGSPQPAAGGEARRRHVRAGHRHRLRTRASDQASAEAPARSRECQARTPGAAAPEAWARCAAPVRRPVARAARRVAGVVAGSPSAAGFRSCARRSPWLLGCLAKQIRQRALAHARALTGWHLRGPPSRAACRRVPPNRPDRTSAPTCLSPAPRQNGPSCEFLRRTRDRRSSPRGARSPPWRGASGCRPASAGCLRCRRSGFRFSRIMASVFCSWTRPRIDRYSH